MHSITCKTLLTCGRRIDKVKPSQVRNFTRATSQKITGKWVNNAMPGCDPNINKGCAIVLQIMAVMLAIVGYTSTRYKPDSFDVLTKYKF